MIGDESIMSGMGGGGGDFGNKGANDNVKSSEEETEFGLVGLSTRPASMARGRYFTMTRSWDGGDEMR